MKTIKEINEKIKKGKAVVVTKDEILELASKKSESRLLKEVDVVTTGTFGPMCSSGAYFNIGHSSPKIKIGGGRVTLNGVSAYAGFAAVDIAIGATALANDDPRNKFYPGDFLYGGGHVIEDFVAGKDLYLEASAYGTDCYPRKELKTHINRKTVKDAVLMNYRNAYQNYNVAVNMSAKTIYTYMGVLKPGGQNANYCSAGQLSPLLNDPLYRTIGIGTRIFLGGGEGFVYWQGTQFDHKRRRTSGGVPIGPSGTLAVVGDLRTMNSEWIRGLSFRGYGATLMVGIGVPIPVLDRDMLKALLVRDGDIKTEIVDYSGKTKARGGVMGRTDYGQLKSGYIKVGKKRVPTASLSSYKKALEICRILKKRIQDKKFFLSESVETFPLNVREGRV